MAAEHEDIQYLYTDLLHSLLWPLHLHHWPLPETPYLIDYLITYFREFAVRIKWVRCMKIPGINLGI